MICNSKHHTLLHEGIQAANTNVGNSSVAPSSIPIQRPPKSNAQQRDQSSDSTSRNLNAHIWTIPSICNVSSVLEQECALLGTALVETEKGISKVARALVDPGAEIPLITKSLVKRLKLTR